MNLPNYNELTEFQKWAIFYVMKNEKMPVSLEGIMKGMCSTLKITIDLENYDKELNRLKEEAKQLSEYRIFTTMHKGLYYDKFGEHTTKGEGEPDEIIPDYYFLSDIGDLYVLQRIIKPLHDAKMSKDIQRIQEFLNKDDGEIFDLLFNVYDPRDQDQGLKKVADVFLKYAMPTIKTFDALHKYVPQ